MSAANDKLKKVQTALGEEADGIPGPLTRAAFEKLMVAAAAPVKPIKGLASSFADPADVAAFKRCKATGKSDTQCFKVGDNGIGAWGKSTVTDKPYCALPREDWAHLTHPPGTKVAVTIGSNTVICELQDTMPAKRFIKNGVVIDLNPGAQKAFGLKPPFLVPASWSWA